MLDNDDGDSGQLAIATSCKAPKIIIKDRDDSHRCCQFAERRNRKFELWTVHSWKNLWVTEGKNLQIGPIMNYRTPPLWQTLFMVSNWNGLIFFQLFPHTTNYFGLGGLSSFSDRLGIWPDGQNPTLHIEKIISKSYRVCLFNFTSEKKPFACASAVVKCIERTKKQWCPAAI